MKEKAAKKQSFLNRKRAEWKEMKLWNGNELCKVDWIVYPDPDSALFYLCAFRCEAYRKQIFPDV